MKNISMMQLVLGITGGILIYSGIKNVDLKAFFVTLATDPKSAFNYSYNYETNKGASGAGTSDPKGLLIDPNTGKAKPSSNTNPATGSGGISA